MFSLCSRNKGIGLPVPVLLEGSVYVTSFLSHCVHNIFRKPDLWPYTSCANLGTYSIRMTRWERSMFILSDRWNVNKRWVKNRFNFHLTADSVVIILFIWASVVEDTEDSPQQVEQIIPILRCQWTQKWTFIFKEPLFPWRLDVFLETPAGCV